MDIIDDKVVFTKEAWRNFELKMVRLEEEALLLDYLREAGVDNWEGYYEAVRMMREDTKE